MKTQLNQEEISQDVTTVNKINEREWPGCEGCHLYNEAYSYAPSELEEQC